MKLHIGCGKKYLDGFKHVDVISYDHVDYICDAGKLNIISDNTVSEIYACHILEHVKRHEVVSVLKEWYRVIRPGGVVRIAVPDFEAIVSMYSNEKDIPSLLGLLYGGQTYDYNFHHITFDFLYLNRLLEEVGFVEVQRYDWKTFLPAEFDDYSRSYLPHMDFYNGKLMSLNVIAKKL